MVYQVSHLPPTHPGFRVAIAAMIAQNLGTSYSVIAMRLSAKDAGPEWMLRRIVEGDYVKRACFAAAFAAQGR